MFHPWTNGEPAAADAVLDITTQAGLDQVRARILREQWAAAQTLTAAAVLLGRAFQAFCGEAACGPEGETSSEPSLRALLPEDVNTVPDGDVADRLTVIKGPSNTLAGLLLGFAKLADLGLRIEDTAWGMDRAKPLADQPVRQPVVAPATGRAARWCEYRPIPGWRSGRLTRRPRSASAGSPHARDPQHHHQPQPSSLPLVMSWALLRTVTPFGEGQGNHARRSDGTPGCRKDGTPKRA